MEELAIEVLNNMNKSIVLPIVLTIVSKPIMWDYYPRFFENISYDQVYEEIKDKVSGYLVPVNGKEYPSKRLSCFFTDVDSEKKHGDPVSPYFSYSNLPVFDWKSSNIIGLIRSEVEKKLDTHFDYVLVHIYRTGNDSISPHSDNEALDTDIASVSFGATRKFRLRRKTDTKGYDYEFHLGTDDLFYMRAGCQKIYKHSVPVEKKVKQPRINLTFRKLDPK